MDNLPDRRQIDDIDVRAVGIGTEVGDGQRVERCRPLGQFRGTRSEINNVQSGIDRDVFMRDIEDVAYRSGIRHCSP